MFQCDFSVASIRSKIDTILLPSISCSATKWIKYVPIKVNVLAWNVKQDALPTRFNLSRRGMPINIIACPICDHGAESSSHLFFACPLATQLRCKISLWWNLPYADIVSYPEWLSWIGSLRISLKSKIILEAHMEAKIWELEWNVAKNFQVSVFLSFFLSTSVHDISMNKIADLGCSRLNKVIHGVFHIIVLGHLEMKVIYWFIRPFDDRPKFLHERYISGPIQHDCPPKIWNFKHPHCKDSDFNVELLDYDPRVLYWTESSGVNDVSPFV
ncbi:RNA-directed DNA polymerase, eukaryota [Tanacetum coccineum]